MTLQGIDSSTIFQRMQSNQHTHIEEREERAKRILAYAKAHPTARLIDIAEALGSSIPVVSRTLSGAGRSPRKAGKRPRITDPVIIGRARQLYKGGASLRGIGRMLGVPYYAIKTIL